MNDKKVLRAQLLLERKQLSTKDNLEYSQQIVTALQTILNKLTFKSLHCYDPIVKNGEVDVSPLLETPDAKVYTSQKIAGEWQIVETVNGTVAAVALIDIFVVPMLGFDADLNRLGYGGGYYDRLLTSYPRAVKIGVCFEQGRQPQIPQESHDVKMDIIVTQASVIVAM